MSSATYPLLRSRRKRRLPRIVPRIVLGSRGRIAAILLVCLGVVAAGYVVLTRDPPPDARRALIDSLVTLRAGNYNAARANARTAITADPGLAIAHAVLARAYLELGDGLAAEAELTRARDAGLDANRLHQLQAHARLLQGDPQGAIDEAAKAPARYAGYATRIRARALAAQGDTRAAQATLSTLLDADPRDAAAWTDLGRLRFDAGDIGGATPAAARAVALAPGEPAALTLQGEVIRSRYGLIASLPWFEQALARDAYYHPALIQYAATLGDAGRNADMLAAARNALAAKPGSPQAFYLQAVLAARAGNTDLARALLQHTGRVVDGLPATLLLSGAIDYADGKFEQAAATWRQLLDAQPMNVAARRLLGAALLRSGDSRAALETLQPIGLRPDADGYALDLIARGSEAVGGKALTSQALDRAAAGAVGAATGFATVDAVGTLEADAAAQADDPTYAIGVIRGLIGAGNTEAAITRARSLVAATPGAPAAQLALGDALALANRYPDAATAYARAADLRFDEPTMLRLVDALGRTGRARDASTALALYLSQNPQSVTGQHMLGRLQLAAADWAPAIETLEGIRRRIGNRDASLLTDLSRAYAGDGDDDVSLRYAKAAYALSPMNPDAADAYGIALAANGNVAGARQLLVKATKLAPGNSVIAGHLAQLPSS